MTASDRYPFTYIRTVLDDDGVLTATLDRPERRNAITPEMHAELTQLFRNISEDRAVRVVILTGAGDGGAILWPLLMGLNRGKEFLLTGEMMGAEEAFRLGLVNHVHPLATLHAEAAAFALRLARGPQVAIQFNKRLANADLVDRVNRIIDASLAMEAITFSTRDHREAVASFIEKRAPRFGT